MVGVATKPEPRRRVDSGILIVKDVVLEGQYNDRAGIVERSL